MKGLALVSSKNKAEHAELTNCIENRFKTSKRGLK